MGASWAAGQLRNILPASEISVPNNNVLVIGSGARATTIYFPDPNDYIIDQSVIAKAKAQGASYVAVEPWAQYTGAGNEYAEEDGIEVLKVGVILARAKSASL